MKAIVYRKYGPPENMSYQEVEKPTPGNNEVLVKLVATSVNPLEWHVSRGHPLVRIVEGPFRPKHSILGADVAGYVESVGDGVTAFKPGDEVFGSASRGGFAEYSCVAEDMLALKPHRLSFEEVAGIPVAGITALQALKDCGNIEPGQKVLINGTSGGVGTYAVQLAKVFDTHVTAVCSTKNVDMVKSLGADHVIDYTKKDFSYNGLKYDLIIDNVGNYNIKGYKRSLMPYGTCVVVGYTDLRRLFGAMIRGPLVRDQKIKVLTIKVTSQDLAFISSLIEMGKVKTIIDRTYKLEQTPEALRYIGTRRARGKVVLNV